MFEREHIQAIYAFYETRGRWRDIQNYRTLREGVGRIKNIFFGDSITEVWPLQEFFPNYSILNRGIGGDNIYGLYERMAHDVFPYSPDNVFMLIGINGIEEEKSRILSHITAVAEIIQTQGIRLYLCSILPLRHPDNWNRFQYQDKIVNLNADLNAWARTNATGFLDYHSLLKDDSGQLAAEYAQPDGTHITFPAYQKMAECVRPFLAK